MGSDLYARCRGKVDAIQNQYDQLLTALDQYMQLLEDETKAEAAVAAPDANKMLALRMQLKGAAKMRDNLETGTLDDMIRFSDRVIRLKHWEDGVFL